MLLYKRHVPVVFRLSSKLTETQMMHQVERDEKNFQFYPSDDVFVIASLLKVRSLITKPTRH